jgi:hypothetical protein
VAEATVELGAIEALVAPDIVASGVVAPVYGE